MGFATSPDYLVNSASLALFIVVVALWTLPWKGVALWKAANLKQKGWFVVLLILNTLAILEIIYIFAVARPKEKAQKEIGGPPQQ